MRIWCPNCQRINKTIKCYIGSTNISYMCKDCNYFLESTFVADPTKTEFEDEICPICGCGKKAHKGYKHK